MKVYLTNQTNKFKEHLEILKSKGTMMFDETKLVEKISEIEIVGKKSLDEIDLNFFFGYKIFPENIMSFYTQWQDENHAMKCEDTIVQQVFLPPVKNFSQKIIFGVRINEIINEKNRRGFSYKTLGGYAEKGISTFTIEEESGKLKFKVHTFSSPGNILAKIVAPVISVPYQAFCTRQALKNVKNQIERQ